MIEQQQVQDNKNKSAGGINVGRFIFTYLCLMAIFVLIMSFAPLQNRIGSYSDYVVYVVAVVLKITGLPAVCRGDIINLPNISLQVNFGCNGLEAVMLYAAAVIAFPAPWRKKTTGLAGGLILIQVFNVLRICLLAYSGLHYRQLFDIIHIYIAQGMSIIVSLVIFFVYLNRLGKPGAHVE